MISVLYVDDEPSLRDLTRAFLEREAGVSVVTADSGEEALKFLDTSSFHAVVSDYQMPSMNGLDLLQEIRARHNGLPFILFTGKGREDVAIAALNRGASFYLQKGGDPRTQYAELVHMIRQAVRHQEMVKELRGSEDRLKRVLEGTQDGFFDWDLAGDHATASPRVYELLGYGTDEITATDIFRAKLVHPDDVGRVLQACRDHCSGKTPQFNEEYRLRTKSGSYVWVNVRARVVAYEKNGNPLRISGALTDVTERKKADESLVQLNQRLTLINSITRHDLLNDLTTILGYLTVLEEAGSLEEVQKYRVKIEESTRKMRSHLDFARDYQEIGKKPAQYIPLEGAISRALIGIDLTNMKLRVELDEFEILADSLIEKVLSNLVDNAKRHGGSSLTTLRVTYRETEKGLTLIIQDDGDGIPHSEKSLIFQKGFGKNTGLGLFLVREVLQITGITIEETGEPGVGARFEITIPPGGYRRKTPCESSAI
ncbi:MAG: response regulator [Methanoregulaceae archaeon]